MIQLIRATALIFIFQYAYLIFKMYRVCGILNYFDCCTFGKNCGIILNNDTTKRKYFFISSLLVAFLSMGNLLFQYGTWLVVTV